MAHGFEFQLLARTNDFLIYSWLKFVLDIRFTAACIKWVKEQENKDRRTYLCISTVPQHSQKKSINKSCKFVLKEDEI